MLSRDEYLAAWSRWHGGTGTEQRAGARLAVDGVRLARPLAGLPPLAATALGLLVAARGVGRRRPGVVADRAPGVLVGLSGLLDSLDGALAIGGGRASRRGFVLDSAVDRLTEVAYAAALWLAGAPGLARRGVRRPVLAARLPAGAGRAGRRRETGAISVWDGRPAWCSPHSPSGAPGWCRRPATARPVVCRHGGRCRPRGVGRRSWASPCGGPWVIRTRPAVTRRTHLAVEALSGPT